MDNLSKLREALLEPFDPSEVKFRQIGKPSGNRALATAYIDARAVMDRLDEVLGPDNWNDTYEVLASGSVVCTLRVRWPGKESGEFRDWGTIHQDVGSESEQPGGDRIKAAFSDALKRAAVKLGIGRYLYHIKNQWVDYDPDKKVLKQVPALPEWAKPKAKPAPVQELTPKQREVLSISATKKVNLKSILQAYSAPAVTSLTDENCDAIMARIASK